MNSVTSQVANGVRCLLVLSLGISVGCSFRERPKPGEFVIERYQSKGYLLLSFPSASHAIYKKMQSDPDRVRRVFIEEIEYPAVIMLVGGKSGEVFDGPLLDDESVKYLVSTHKLDPTVVTQVFMTKDGRETDRMTGDQDANKLGGQL
jgi:hypothetical protein